MTPQPRTPLSMEFVPEPPEDHDPFGLVVAEPSFEVPGRIFVGSAPVDKRVGLHLIPEDARRLRDHISKLLWEAQEGTETPIDAHLDREAPVERVDWQKRIQAAVSRARKRKWFLFKVEFQFGDIQGVIGRLRD